MKRSLIFPLALLAFAVPYAVSANEQEASLPTIHMVMFDDQKPEDEELVEKVLSAITSERLGVVVDIDTMNAMEYSSEYNLLLSANPDIDLIAMIDGADTMADLVSMDLLLPLEDLVKEYGASIQKSLEGILQTGVYRQHLYGIPSIRQFGNMYGIVLARDIAEQCGIDPSAITSFDDLDEIFAKVHKTMPALTVLSPYNRSWGLANYLTCVDPLGNESSGVLLNGGLSDLNVVNYFETEEYLNALKKVRQWYLQGYIDQDVLLLQESGPALMNRGESFSCFNVMMLENDQKNPPSSRCLIPLTSPVAATSSSQRLLWGIPSSCSYPRETMALLDLMYSDPEVVNLLQFGIEGIHYTIQEDGTMLHERHLEGRSGYYRPYAQAGNLELLLTAQSLGADFPERLQKLKEETKVSLAYGFVFDKTPVESELSAIDTVLNTYRIPLELGCVDPDTELPIMLRELKEAGIDRVIQEKQRQLDLWATQRTSVRLSIEGTEEP